MADESEWKQLPTDEKIQHKVWKARSEGYDEAIKSFQMQDSEKSPEFNKYLGLLKKMVTDSNAIAQEKALEAVLCYIENAAVAGKAAGEVCNGVVTKCLNAPRQKTKEKGMEILLMYIEVEKQDIVQEELLKGLSAKQPKTVFACVQTFTEGLRQFGPKVIQIKPLIKELSRLLEDRDKTVRDETKALAVEIFRWIGAPLRSQLASLKAVQLTELEAEFANLQGEKAVPERFLRSQQAKMESAPESTGGGGAGPGAAGRSGGPVVEEIDPLEFVEAVDVISKIPKDFYEKIEEKKWSERRDALDVIDKLTDNPKLEPGDFGDLMRTLLKVIAKDTNVMVVALATKIVGQIARGIRKKFSIYGPLTVKACLDKFKEKKLNVVTALRDAIDAAFASTTFDAISEDLLAAIDNKNPSIRIESSLFLTRVFTNSSPAQLNKKLQKMLIPPLVKIANDTVPEVREAAYGVLGTAMKVIGEKAMAVYLGDMDPLKAAKIKEYFDKATLKSSGVGGGDTCTDSAAPTGRGRPTTAPPASKRPGLSSAVTKKPGSAGVGVKGKAPTKSGTAAKKPAGKKDNKPAPGADSLPTELVLGDDAVEEKATDLLGEACIEQLSNANWKERLAGMERVLSVVKGLSSEEIPCQVMVKITCCKKPGLKDNNFQVLKNKLELLTYLAENAVFTKVSAEACLEDIFEKIGDVKNGENAKNALTGMAEACSLEFVGIQVAQGVFNLKNPKNQSEALIWLAQAIKEFGLRISPKELIKYIRTGFQANNAAVRQAAITLTASLYLYMGETLRTLISDEKPALLTLIDAEIEKVKGTRPPVPVRGLKGAAGGEEREDTEGGDDELDGFDGGGIDEDALVPRSNISSQLSEELFNQLESKNWKERKEGLDKVQGILGQAKFITGDVEELPQHLVRLLSDSNKILAKQTMVIVMELAKALTKSDCRNMFKGVIPGVLSGLGDAKPMNRLAAVETLNVWTERVSFLAVAESELINDSLKIESPVLRSELLNWLAVQLTKLNEVKGAAKKLTVEFKNILIPFYACLEDRNVDVRKKSQDALLPLMIALGYDTLVRYLGKMKPASKDALLPILTKTREQLPAVKVEPSRPATAPAAASGARVVVPSAATDSGGGKNAAKEEDSEPVKTVRGKGTAAKAPPVESKKKKEAVEDVVSPALSSTSNKEQRFTDEKKRKLLRWDFDTPQKTHAAQLQTLCSANFSPDLMSALFHTDFKQHIRGIELLSRFLEEGGQEALDATQVNLDLLLKWMVLRFFETNPSVIMRGLEYLNKVFSRLADEGYHLSEYEAQSFLPYLVIKSGDPKENIRRDVRSLFKLVCQVYPASKLFTFLKDGLVTKTARQRQECLEELGCLIELYSIDVCGSTPAPALKIIAEQIADRDSGVRTASLNTLVAVYNIIGEKIYKLIGNLSEKERSMLEERIKRAGKTQSEQINSATVTRPSKNSVVDRRDTGSTPAQQGRQPNPMSQRNMNPPATQHKPVNQGEFQLDMEENEMMVSRHEMPKLIQVESDLNDIYKPIDRPAIKARPQSPSAHMLRNSVDATSAITMVMTQISATDVPTSIQALAQIDEVILNEEKRDLLLSYVDQLVMMVTMQLKMATSKHLEDPDCSQEQLTRLLKALLATLHSLFNSVSLAREASRDRLKELFQAQLLVMLDERIVEMTEGDQVVRSLNIICVRILENGNKTRVLCCLLRLLHECVDSGHHTSKFLQLVMKCIWRVTRNLQTTVTEYSLESILLECHTFFKAFPSASWKSRKSDIPLRTIKTLVHTLCQIKGQTILTYLENIPNKEDSELESYLIRTAKTVAANAPQEADVNATIGQGDGGPKSNLSSATFKRPGGGPKLAANQDKVLAEIFKRIGSKEFTREGLNDLYDFKQTYPEADLSPYMEKTSHFFKRYIEQGIKNIETERQRVTSDSEPGTGVGASSSNTTQSQLLRTKPGHPHDHTSNSGPVNPQIFFDRLRAVRKEFGLDTSVSSEHPSTTGPPLSAGPGSHSSRSDAMLDLLPTTQASLDKPEILPPPPEDQQEEDNGGAENKSSLSQNELLDLKRRLDRIKNLQK